MGKTTTTRRGAVAILTLDNPPVNGLGFDLRMSLVAALDAAAADPDVRAIVLTGAGKSFSAGAEIKELGTSLAYAEPNLPSVIAAIEACEKPVIAAVNGTAMGGGVELALGCHYRVAVQGAPVALPEVKLGLIPGAGGTQRLPRAVGLEVATNMIVSGASVPSEMLAFAGLFDDVTDGDVVECAVGLATRLADVRPLPLVKNKKVEHPNAAGFLAYAKNGVAAVAKGMPAPLKALEAIAASSKPIDEGLRTERELFLSLMLSPESAALRHAFFAERAAAKLADVPDDTPARAIKSAAIVGAGTMGGGIAMNFANAGIPVTVLEMKQDALDRGLGVIKGNYENSAKKGKLDPDKMAKRLSLITGTLDYAALKDADIVIEAVFEDLGVKETVFKKLDEVMKPGAILASNTSTLDLNRIAKFTRRPQDVIGTHFFSPANVMPLLEIVRGAETGKDVLATVLGLSKKIKKTGVVSGVCDGFIGNRMLGRYMEQTLLLVEEGASPQQIDRALEKFGWVMGPFRVSDMAGNDISWYIRKRQYAEHPEARRWGIVDKLCELGRFGQKTGAGWYRYEKGRRDALTEPLVDELIANGRKELGLTPRKISDDEIVERCMLALANEGAKILEEGIAQRAGDIDIVYLTGYGFPVYRGGPMFYADSLGLYNVVRAMAQLAKNPHAPPGFWTPAPLLAKLAAAGKSFNQTGTLN